MGGLVFLDQYHYIAQTRKHRPPPPRVSKYMSAPRRRVPTRPITVSFTVTTLMGCLRPVFETPQLSQTRKKRPPSPFITHGRLKRIKCVRIKSRPHCGACEAGNTPCSFRDRERYQAGAEGVSTVQHI